MAPAIAKQPKKSIYLPPHRPEQCRFANIGLRLLPTDTVENGRANLTTQSQFDCTTHWNFIGHRKWKGKASSNSDCDLLGNVLLRWKFYCQQTKNIDV